ncbi:hypothetical protein [Psychrobacillus sp. FSL K6-1464]|uniref:hypothetical protein n=1 Tax=Psychrobacillus sp. FSL K6-1464 TaxID=2921545 RepID=UPI0030FD0D96
MNLRQKRKQAKKELGLMEVQPGNFWWYEKREKLQSVINTKRKLKRYYNPDSKLDSNNFTYMEFTCGMTILSIAKNKNGKRLSKSQKSTFLKIAASALIKHVPVIYERYRDRDNLPDDFHVIYNLSVSTDSTKQKKMYDLLDIYQWKNSTELFIKEDGKYVKLL